MRKTKILIGIFLVLLLVFGCEKNSTEPENKEIIHITYPNSSTVWSEFQTETYCEWNNATGSTVQVEIYQGTTYKGIYHGETDNDGHCDRTTALEDWGTGTDFKLKVIDSNDNFGWSDEFTIESGSSGTINVTYPNSSTVWSEFQTETYCEWNNATGSTVQVEIYQGTTYKGIYHGETDNDGHCDRTTALEDWGTGTDFKLKVIDSNNNFGWSDKFTIE